MKRRTFYVINLDRGRIFTLSILTLSVLGLVYATGFRLGRKNPEPPEYSSAKALDPMASNVDSESMADPMAATALQPGEYNNSIQPLSLSELEKGPENAAPELEVRTVPGQTLSGQNLSGQTASGQTLSSQTAPGSTTRKSTIGDVASSLPDSATRPEAQPASEKKSSRIAAKKAPSTKTRPRQKKTEKKPAGSGQTVSLKNVASDPESIKNTAPAAGKETGPANRYALQIGSFYSEKAASSMSGTLRKQGFHPYVEKTGGKYNVRLGRTDSQQGIQNLEKRLRSKHFDPVRIKIN